MKPNTLQGGKDGADRWICWVSLRLTQPTVLHPCSRAQPTVLCLTESTVCYFNISQDNILNESFEKKCASIEALSIDMAKAFDADDWPALLKLNNKIDVLLQSIGIDKLTATQKIQYKHVLRSFYQAHRLTLQKCSESYKDTGAELGLLRKQQSAGSIYRQIQDSQ